jgi:hypothetical protein
MARQKQGMSHAMKISALPFTVFFATRLGIRVVRALGSKAAGNASRAPVARNRIQLSKIADSDTENLAFGCSE